MEYEKKLKLLKHPKTLIKIDSLVFALLLLLILLSLNGCAQPQWGEVLQGDQITKPKQNYTRILDKSQACSPALDGEAVLKWKSNFTKISFSGFFQVKVPSFLKFTALNPFGQPFFAVASDGQSFQSINTAKKTFLEGSLSSFAIRHDIPPIFLAGQWGSWITGRPLSSATHILEIRDDVEARGIWFGVSDTAETTQPQEYVLFDISREKLIKRIIMDPKGNRLATISYGNWQNIDGCNQPLNITISGLTFGAEAHLELSDMRRAHLQPEDFNITVPPTYSQQFMP